jgi:hypothetical protein
MFNTFTVKCKSAPAPVTIIAPDADEALKTFHVWQKHHAPGSAHDDAKVCQLHELDLALQPQLQDAVEKGRTGVAWWLGHREGWTITAPADKAAGEIAPPTTSVCCYVFPDTEDFGTFYAFAETRERAIATLHLHSLERLGWDAVYGEAVELALAADGRENHLARRYVQGTDRRGGEGRRRLMAYHPADRRGPNGRPIRTLL